MVLKKNVLNYIGTLNLYSVINKNVSICQLLWNDDVNVIFEFQCTR